MKRLSSPKILIWPTTNPRFLMLILQALYETFAQVTGGIAIDYKG